MKHFNIEIGKDLILDSLVYRVSAKSRAILKGGGINGRRNRC